MFEFKLLFFILLLAYLIVIRLSINFFISIPGKLHYDKINQHFVTKLLSRGKSLSDQF